MNPQLPLALRWPRRQRFEHFHAGANAPALAAVRELAVKQGVPWVYLHGNPGSGRSHLLLAACQSASQDGWRVQYLPLAGLADRAAAIRGIAGSELLALDDLGGIAGDAEAEHALFDLYNQTRADGGALLFAADASPELLGLCLPDLRSRLALCSRFVMQPLSDPEQRWLLRKEAAARGIELDENVLDWLFSHYDRGFGALLELLEKIDQASLAARRKITVPFLRSLLVGPERRTWARHLAPE